MAARSRGPILFLVPARGGSRRIPGKNLHDVAGIPLVGHAIRTARLAAAALPAGQHLVACSTDDGEIAAAARAWGADVVDRPAHLATDIATSVDVVIHALGTVEASGARPSTVVLLQPTSPLTEPSDVLGALALFHEADGRGVVSVTRTHPVEWHQARNADGTLRAIEVVEPGDAGFVLSGAFYVCDADLVRETRSLTQPGATLGFEVPPERSIDIDEPSDLDLAEQLAAARPVAAMAIDDRAIGDGPVLVIAEAGVNHNGDEGLAHRLIDAAAAAHADAVKFQTFDPEALAAHAAPTAEYQRASGEISGQREMLTGLALPSDVWPRLQAHARECGLSFLSTPFDDASARLLDGLDVPAFKVGSGELTNIPFLERLARFGRPMLVSTGMADMVEVAAAVDAIRLAGNDRLALFHCVSAYPARPEDANLRAMGTMRAAFGVPTGWSDHTPGIELPIAATALGASMIEKHITLDRTMTGPDHAASLEPDEFDALVAAVRVSEAALGSGHKVLVDAERPIAEVARRSLHWRGSLPAGHVVTEDDLAALRPGTGLSPARQSEIVGRRTARAVEGGTVVAGGDLEGGA
jgi:N,N'-diacetyllegionaminate synthase